MKTWQANLMPSLKYVSRYQFPHHQIPSSVHRSKMRLAPKSSHAIMPLCQSNAILGQRRAKIIASRLQYVIFLLEIDNL
jgi:hypothetical protein